VHGSQYALDEYSLISTVLVSHRGDQCMMNKTFMSPVGSVFVELSLLNSMSYEDIVSMVIRHSQGDWGAISGKERTQNFRAKYRRGPIKSRFKVKKLCVSIESTADRSRTFVALV
jgi:hypothetical protein